MQKRAKPKPAAAAAKAAAAAASVEALRDFVAPLTERTEENVKVAREEVKQRRAQVEASLNEDMIFIKTQAKNNLEKVLLTLSTLLLYSTPLLYSSALLSRRCC
jgi:hypothetical protein